MYSQAVHVLIERDKNQYNNKDKSQTYEHPQLGLFCIKGEGFDNEYAQCNKGESNDQIIHDSWHHLH
jgi:hypothetical protein